MAKLFVVQFSASWCGACRVMTPILADLAMVSVFAHALNLLTLKSNIDLDSSSAKTWGLRYPVLVDGGWRCPVVCCLRTPIYVA